MSGDPMKELLEAEAAKWFGNDLTFSQAVEKDEKFFEACFSAMAETMKESLFLGGYRAVPDSQRVIYQLPEEGDPFTQQGVAALKLKAAFTSEPAQFVAYCGYKMEEYRRAHDRVLADNNRLRILLAKNNIAEYEDE